MAKEDETLFGQKLEDVGTWIYDRLLAQTERIGRELDAQLYTVCKEFAEWRDQHMINGRKYIDCKVATITSDGKRRTLVVSMGFGQKVEEYTADGHLVGTTVFVNRNYLHQPSNGYSEAIAFISPDDPLDPRNGGFIFYQSWYFNSENPYIGSSVYGVIRGENNWTDLLGIERRIRYANPEISNLPSPIDKAREIVDMLKRGNVTHKLAYIGDKPIWQPV